jgi:hypothetical protein
MKSFYNFFESAEDMAGQEPKRVSDDAVTVFGRHQPPHLGHKLTLDRAHDIANNIGDKASGDQTFYTSRSMDPKKNPLPFQLKQKFLQKMFPEHKDKWDTDENVRTILGAATKAFDKGYKNFHFVGGDDRRQGMEDLLRRYNGNLYNFDNIYSHSAGPRDEEGLGDDPIAKLSASKLRGMAGKGDFLNFLSGMPSNDTFGETEARELFDAIQMYSQRNESVEEIRDLYRRHELFLEGDWVECDTTGLVGSVHRRGANHLICVTEDDVMFKCFIDQVTTINN